jgi:hypothetical protein
MVLPLRGVNVPLGRVLLLRCYILHRLLWFPSEMAGLRPGANPHCCDEKRSAAIWYWRGRYANY